MLTKICDFLFHRHQLKIKLTIELEFPDGVVTPTTKQQNLEFDQILFDAYVNYATRKHFEDSVDWCARGKVGSTNEEPTAKSIYEYHDNWGKICSQAKWNWEVL